MEAGKNVSYDDDLGTGWKHLVVTRDGGLLKLYVNGELRGTSSAFDNSDYDLSNRNPLRIGTTADVPFQAAYLRLAGRMCKQMFLPVSGNSTG